MLPVFAGRILAVLLNPGGGGTKHWNICIPLVNWGEAFWHVWAPGFPGNARWFPGYLLVSWWSPGGRGRVCRRSRGHRVALSMFRDLRCHRGELLSEFVTVKT